MKKENEVYSNKIKDALLKKALGYSADEIIEEYLIDKDGNCVLSKKKVTKKNVAPDTNSAKILLSFFNQVPNSDLDNMTEEELIKEKNRLLGLLEKENYEDDDGE